ncbi:hypothetical protein EFK44_13175 [Lactococcus lactis subsp. lactis]|nr:hypothetical protein [Lactococcus lactis subsp. lactis]
MKMKKEADLSYKKTKLDISYKKIDQYHDVIGRFSKFSFTIKQLCITTLGLCLTIIFSIGNEGTVRELPNRSILELSLISIPVLVAIFFVLDATTYIYQDSMQKNMYKEEKNLLGLDIVEFSKEKRFFGNQYNGWFRAITIKSNIMYWILMILSWFCAVLNAIVQRMFTLSVFVMIAITIIYIIFFCFFYFKRKKPTKWFISYTTKDREVSLEFLKKYKYILINKMDIDAYIDLIDNDKTSTHKIQKKIEREIRKSKKLILINTNSVKNSGWVNFELETANKNSIIIEEKKIEDIKLKIKKNYQGSKFFNHL